MRAERKRSTTMLPSEPYTLRYDSVLDMMRSVHLVRLAGHPNFAACGDLWAMCELALPGGMKDRVALNMVLAAETSGALRPGGTIVESSSGTLAEGLARVGTLRGYKVTIVTDPRLDTLSVRKLAALGAELDIVRVPHPEGGWQQARLERLRERLAGEPDAFWPCQYESSDNPDAYRDAAEQIWAAFGSSLRYLVGSVGSGGSLCGMARVLKSLQPDLKVVAVDAVGSVLFGQPERSRQQSGHGNSIAISNVDHSLVDSVHWLADGEVFQSCHDLARREGLFAGGSSGAVYAVASWLASRSATGELCLCIMPDRGDRYFDTIYACDKTNAGHPLAAAPEQIDYHRDVADRWSMATVPHDASKGYIRAGVPVSSDILAALGLTRRIKGGD